MMWRSALVSSALILVFSVVVIASTGNLEYVDSILDLTTSYYPQVARLSSDPIPGLTEPAYSGTPAYASVTLAEMSFALALDRDGDSGKLYVDADGSKALARVDWIQQLWDGSYMGSVSFQLPASDGNSTRAYRLALVWTPATPMMITYFRDNRQEGQIELGGVKYRIAIIDENSDGLFDDLDNDLLLIDIDRDSELLASSDSHERYWLDAPFNIDGTVYAAASVSRDGSRIVIDKSDRWVETNAPLTVGSPAPHFSVVDADGERLSLSSLQGKIVVLDFWASWCAPCLYELPYVEAIANDYADRGVVVIGIDSDRSEGAFRSAVSYFGLTYRQVFDGADGKISSLYRVSGIPMTYLIDRDGIIRGKGLRGDDLKQAVASSLASVGAADATLSQEAILSFTVSPAEIALSPASTTLLQLSIDNRSIYPADDIAVTLVEAKGFSLDPAEADLKVLQPFSKGMLELRLTSSPDVPIGTDEIALQVIYTYCIDISCLQIVDEVPVTVVVGRSGGTTTTKRELPAWLVMSIVGGLVGVGVALWRLTGVHLPLYIALCTVIVAGLVYGVILGQHEQAQGIAAVLCTSCVGIDEARGEAPPLSDSAISALAGLQKSIDLIVFYAPWCRTCPYAKSMVREMAERTDLLSYSFVNVDTNRELAESNGVIRSKRTIVPAIVRVDTGDIIFGIEDLEARLLKVLAGES